MTSHIESGSSKKIAWIVMPVLTILAVLMTAAPQQVFGLDDPVPPAIRDVTMGMSSAAVLEKITNLGTFSRETVPKRGTPKIVWALPDNLYFQNVAFEFTEKDRLYLIRYAPKPTLGRDANQIKRAFIETFKFDMDNPMRLAQSKDSDILMYSPESDLDSFPQWAVKQSWGFGLLVVGLLVAAGLLAYYRRRFRPVVFWGVGGAWVVTFVGVIAVVIYGGPGTAASDKTPNYPEDALYFFEFIDKKTGAKTFELFNRVVSAQDRPVKQAEKKPEATQSGKEGAPAVSPPVPVPEGVPATLQESPKQEAK